MIMSKTETEVNQLTRSKKRRLRRKKLQTLHKKKSLDNNTQQKSEGSHSTRLKCLDKSYVHSIIINNSIKDIPEMSSKEISTKSREEVIAAREAKKMAKLKAKNKTAVNEVKKDPIIRETNKIDNNIKKDNQVTEVEKRITTTEEIKALSNKVVSKSKDEVDRATNSNVDIKIDSHAVIKENNRERDQIKKEREAKKAAKQAKKKNTGNDGIVQASEAVSEVSTNLPTDISQDTHINDMTVKDVVETLKDIVNVAKEVKEVTAKVQAIDLDTKKSDEINKSKAELRAERRAKQEAQRAAKQVAPEKKPINAIPQPKSDAISTKLKEDKPVKQKILEKPKGKSQNGPRVNWFQHLYSGHDKESLRKIPINSNLHPAIIKLGVQLASRVVKGSNARCIALLDALKRMVRDYTLPAKTEFARGLESHLATSLDFLWSMRQASASQTNAVKFFRHHLTQLPNNVDEFDAKKTLQEEIDRYIREQIDVAGEAISITVRNKISNGDHILTYGCSSLIERILVDAWEAEVEFRTVVVGNRVQPDAREMLRRLSARGLPCTYIDISSLSFLINTIDKVVLGASALLVNGSVLGAIGTAQVALVARSANVPVLVACETHKFSERVQTDAFVYNEIGDPDDLIDKSDDSSPLKDWRSNPNLTPLNLLYDVTPPSLVTAVVTELAILPCTSAPVVVRFKLSEYGI